MKRICLGCCEIVDKHINENHNGIAIHYGQDWYCGPVVSVADDVADGTLKQIKSDREVNDWHAELAAEQQRTPDAAFCRCSKSIRIWHDGGCRNCALPIPPRR